jgi:tRNA threonylcarbamoyladenosine biosynthesis protein TsaE
LQINFFGLLKYKSILETAYSQIAKAIVLEAGETKILTFKGNLGAGKTTLIKYIIKELGISDFVQSPTFSLVNIYADKVFHFDCYRLKNVFEALDFGIEEYLDTPDKYCLIEWPEVISSLIPCPHLEILIEHEPDQTRSVTITQIN